MGPPVFVQISASPAGSRTSSRARTRKLPAWPPGQMTVGRDAIYRLWETVLAKAPHFERESSLPTLVSGDIALTATAPKDDAGARAQVARRQPDGTWLRLLDQPEFVQPEG